MFTKDQLQTILQEKNEQLGVVQQKIEHHLALNPELQQYDTFKVHYHAVSSEYDRSKEKYNKAHLKYYGAGAGGVAGVAAGGYMGYAAAVGKNVTGIPLFLAAGSKAAVFAAGG
ncbi:MAG: hypothetical protein K2Q14_02885, partial [Gammaproteobacteria bacterium]|nr:hypothetical protein [Gammaproteobacteria bacterium]